ncbi:MAG: hypothetical protein ACKVIT_02715 [Candidatus Puniceispirillales bacterium]|jgi:hypothetical protein|tara:strand:+ start:2463 stop:2717 length:255 start_codon:yes stop_codon:yes gene_type:complete
MRRYVIIFLAGLFAIAIFFLTKYILQKLTYKNSVFIASFISLVAFILIVFSSFLLLENNAAKPSYNYKPPLIQNGKVINGQFAK